MSTAHTTESKPGELGSGSGAPKPRLARAIVVPAVLVCVVILTAACGGGGNSPSSSANALISQGLRAESSGSTQQAIKDFKAAVSTNPVNPVAYYDLGVIYQQYIKQPSQAVNYYNKAILADSTYKPALYNLAILDTPSDPQAAINLYNQLLKLNPNDSNVLYNLGLILIKQGQTTQGDSDVKKAVLINPALKGRVPPGVTP